MSIALQPDGAYTVTGLLKDTIEFCPATSRQGGVATSRVVRLWLFPWAIGEGRESLAILHYGFASVVSTECQSVTRLAHLTSKDDALDVLDRVDLSNRYQLGLGRVETRDITGDGFDELILEAAAGDHSDLLVYSLSAGFFDKVVDLFSRLDHGAEHWTQKLDLARTLRERGNRFCFVKTSQNHVSHPCYPPFFGRQ